MARMLRESPLAATHAHYLPGNMAAIAIAVAADTEIGWTYDEEKDGGTGGEAAQATYGNAAGAKPPSAPLREAAVDLLSVLARDPVVVLLQMAGAGVAAAAGSGSGRRQRPWPFVEEQYVMNVLYKNVL